MSFIASSCVLYMRKTSLQGDNIETKGGLSKLLQDEEVGGRNHNFSEELKKEEEKVINRIYEEDQKEIEVLQTSRKTKKNIEKHVDDFISAQEKEKRTLLMDYQIQLSPRILWKQRREVEKFVKGENPADDFTDILQIMKMELLEGEKENEQFRNMMKRKLLVYDELCGD